MVNESNYIEMWNLMSLDRWRFVWNKHDFNLNVSSLLRLNLSNAKKKNYWQLKKKLN